MKDGALAATDLPADGQEKCPCESAYPAPKSVVEAAVKLATADIVPPGMDLLFAHRLSAQVEWRPEALMVEVNNREHGARGSSRS